MIPNGWEVKTLKDICKMQAGKFVKASNILDYKLDDTYPCYGGNGFRGYTSTFTHNGTYSLIGRQGALCGNITLAKDKFHATEHAVVTTPNENIDTLWLYYKLIDLDLNRYATGQAQPGLSVKNLEKVEALLPTSKIEQQKIAKILTTWDKAIDTTERLIDNSKQQKKALMQQLLTGKKRLLDDNGKRFEGEWEEVELKSVLNVMKSGLSRKLSSQNIGIAVIRSNNIGSKFTNEDDLKYWYLEDPQGANIFNYILDDGDLLVNFINSLSQIGKACLYKKPLNTDAIYTTNILRIKPNEKKIDSVFLYLLTQTSYYDSFITSITKPAVNQASFTTKDFGKFKFGLPSMKEQQKIAAVLTNADKEIELLEQQLADLQQEKKALMQVLLTGKKRVRIDG